MAGDHAQLGQAETLVTQLRWSLGVITYFLLSVAESGHHSWDMTCNKGQKGMRQVGLLQTSSRLKVWRDAIFCDQVAQICTGIAAFHVFCMLGHKLL